MRYAIALAAVLLCGCANKTADREHYLANNQTQHADDIRKGMITKGMTKDEVRAAWGKPCGHCIGTRSASWGDTWEYNIFGSSRPGSGTYVYFNPEGRVIGWSK
jgi:hypothetical protein